MRNHQISSSQIPHLLRVTADVFRNVREEVKAPNNLSINLEKESDQMHFIVDLLKDLVDMAYPEEEPKNKYNEQNNAIDAFIYGLDIKPIDKVILKDLDKAFQELEKLMKSYKSPKAGEF